MTDARRDSHAASAAHSGRRPVQHVVEDVEREEAEGAALGVGEAGDVVDGAATHERNASDGDTR